MKTKTVTSSFSTSGNINSDSSLRLLNTQKIYTKFKAKAAGDSDTPIKLIDLFPEDVVQGKLYLDQIDFYRLGPVLENIDFSNCVLTNCNFNYIKIENCNFTDAILKGKNRFRNAEIEDSLGVVPKSPDIAWYKRLDLWTKQMWLHYPQDLFFLNNNWAQVTEADSTDYFMYSHYKTFSNNWINFTHPSLDLQKDSFLGWKLHVSVHQDDYNRAFIVLAPLISQYSRVFKGIDIDTLNLLKKNGKSIDERVYYGGQITIYLMRNDQQMVTSAAALELVNKINTLLIEQKIRVGIPPASDALTISPYVSLRHDKLIVPLMLMQERKNSAYSDYNDDYYLPGRKLIGLFNPSHVANPYDSLLASKSPPFNVLTWVQSYKIEAEAPDLDFLMSIAMLAFLREYSCIDNLNDEEMDIFRYQCANDFLPLNRALVRLPYRDNPQIAADVKVAMMIFDCSWIGRARVEQFDLSSLCSNEGDLYQALRYIENLYKNSMSRPPRPLLMDCLDQGSEFMRYQMKPLEKAKELYGIKKHANNNPQINYVAYEMQQIKSFLLFDPVVFNTIFLSKDEFLVIVPAVESLINQDVNACGLMSLLAVYYCLPSDLTLEATVVATKKQNYFFKFLQINRCCSPSEFRALWFTFKDLSSNVSLLAMQQQLIALADKGNMLAKIFASIALMHDILPYKEWLDSDQAKRIALPTDHTQAKKYLAEVLNSSSYKIRFSSLINSYFLSRIDRALESAQVIESITEKSTSATTSSVNSTLTLAETSHEDVDTFANLFAHGTSLANDSDEDDEFNFTALTMLSSSYSTGVPIVQSAQPSAQVENDCADAPFNNNFMS